MYKESGFTWKLGMFVAIGGVLFMATIYFIGKQQNLFGDTFNLKSQFKTVSGLKIGNNVRFSGINVGTVSDIEIINDSAVMVQLVLNKDIQKFIKTDAKASIGSDGLMGDKVLTIYPGTSSQKIIQDNSKIASNKSIEMEDLMKGVKATVDNAEIITGQLAEFSYKINNGKGTLSKLLVDQEMGQKLDKTLSNLETGTKGFSENMEAAKSNFLLKGYFNKKKKTETKKTETKKAETKKEEAKKEEAKKEESKKEESKKEEAKKEEAKKEEAKKEEAKKEEAKKEEAKKEESKKEEAKKEDAKN